MAPRSGSSGSAKEGERLLAPSPSPSPSPTPSHSENAARFATTSASTSSPHRASTLSTPVTPSKAKDHPLGQAKTLVIPVAASQHKAAVVLETSSSDPLLCRICLEDDEAANLCSPCGCTGTQRYAHKVCIQTWINEKGHTRCEICEQQYRGEFTVPPQPAAAADELHPLFASIRIEDGLVDAHHMEGLEEEERYHQRNPAASWCFTFIIFLLFLVVLHHTMGVAEGMDGNADGGSGGSGSGAGPPVPVPSGPGGGSGPGDAGSGAYASNLSLFLFWVGTKALLIGIPLYTVMRIASRQARQEQYDAIMRASAAEAGGGRRLVVRMRQAGGQIPVGVV